MTVTLPRVLPAVVYLAGMSSHAAVVAGWDFSSLPGGANNYGPSPYAATTVLSNVTVGGLTRGSGIGTTGGTGGANAWGGTGFATTNNTTAALGLAAGDYATFQVTAAAGYQLSLSDIAAYNVRRSGSGPTTGQWQYQVGSSGTFVNLGSAITWGGTTSASGNAQSSISLSGIADLQNIPAGTTVTFRVINYGATGATGTWYLNDPNDAAANDFVLNGTLLAVPEPTSVTIAALATLGIFWRRKR